MAGVATGSEALWLRQNWLKGADFKIFPPAKSCFLVFLPKKTRFKKSVNYISAAKLTMKRLFQLGQLHSRNLYFLGTISTLTQLTL